jgi:hypothetical protein
MVLDARGDVPSFVNRGLLAGHVAEGEAELTRND